MVAQHLSCGCTPGLIGYVQSSEWITFPASWKFGRIFPAEPHPNWKLSRIFPASWKKIKPISSWHGVQLEKYFSLTDVEMYENVSDLFDIFKMKTRKRAHDVPADIKPRMRSEGTGLGQWLARRARTLCQILLCVCIWLNACVGPYSFYCWPQDLAAHSTKRKRYPKGFMTYETRTPKVWHQARTHRRQSQSASCFKLENLPKVWHEARTHRQEQQAAEGLARSADSSTTVSVRKLLQAVRTCRRSGTKHGLIDKNKNSRQGTQTHRRNIGVDAGQRARHKQVQTV